MIEIPAWTYGLVLFVLAATVRSLWQENKKQKHIIDVQNKILEDYWKLKAEKKNDTN